MTLWDFRRPVSLAAFTLILVACLPSQLTKTATEEIQLPARLSLLNGSAVPLTRAVFYTVSVHSIVETLNPLAVNLVGQAPGWFSELDARGENRLPIGDLNIGDPVGACASKWKVVRAMHDCRSGSRVVFNLEYSAQRFERFDNLVGLLEVLNRPLTLLPYNSEADSRILQWRTSLAAAVAESRARGDAFVGVCSELTRTPVITVTASGVAFSAERVRPIIESAIRRAGVDFRKITWSDSNGTDQRELRATLDGDFVVAAAFKRIQLSPGYGGAKVDYELSGTTRIGLTGDND